MELDGTRVVSGQRLTHLLLVEGDLAEHLEAADAVGKPVAREVGDVRVELPQPMPGGVVADQPSADHRTVGVDDPAARRRDRAVVGLGIGDLFGTVQHGGAAS